MAQSINFSPESGNASIGGATSLTPAPVKKLANENYLTAADYDFTQQYLPDLYEKEFERYGNRSVASFLRMVGAEMPTNSDLIKWSEQGRLHVQASGTITDGNTIAITGHSLRNNQTIIISKDGGSLIKAIVTDASAADAVDVATFASLNLVDDASAADGAGPFDASDAVKVFVYGSEFKKGSDAMSGSLESSFES